MFIEENDYRVVIGEPALKVVAQASPENRANAEIEAIEEISGYLRPKYDCDKIFSAEDGKRMMEEQCGETPFKDSYQTQNVFFQAANDYREAGKKHLSWSFLISRAGSGRFPAGSFP